MRYIDAFLMPVRRDAEANYHKWADISAEVWMANGALSYVEARADDVPFGVLTSFPRAVQLTEDEAAELLQRAQEIDDYQITIDLEKCEVRDDQDFRAKFPMDEFVRHCLLKGLDDIGLTLQHEEEIAAYEAQHPAPTTLTAS